LAVGDGAADHPFRLRFTGHPQRPQQPGPRPGFREARATQDVLPSISLGIGLLQVAAEVSEIADHVGTAGAETAEEALRIRRVGKRVDLGADLIRVRRCRPALPGLQGRTLYQAGGEHGREEGKT
jgi:hypothetical protein